MTDQQMVRYRRSSLCADPVVKIKGKKGEKKIELVRKKIEIKV